MALIETDFPSVETAASALAEMLARVVRESIAKDGNAILAVSGGRTPRLVFERLNSLNLPWSKVVVTLTDERWVPSEHVDSNERLVRKYLLTGLASSAQCIPLYDGSPDPVAGLEACESRLKDLGKPIDAIYLGMGPDGHIASLFPGEHFIRSHESKCVAVAESPTRLARLSLSIDTILGARAVFLLYSGLSKHKAYIAAKQSKEFSGSALQAVLAQQDVPVNVLRAI